jgi:hypothetical protein
MMTAMSARQSAFSSLETAPMTVAPNAAAHWHMIRPTPPAAAWIRMVRQRAAASTEPDQHVHGHALQQHCSGLLVANVVGQFDQPVGGDQPRLE